jgi:hypothetical protein
LQLTTNFLMSSFERNYPTTQNGVVEEQLYVQRLIQEQKMAFQEAFEKLLDEHMKKLGELQSHLIVLESLGQVYSKRNNTNPSSSST